ncbi:Asp23/Gls24 family envelope stress response protein [Dehalobacter sp. DCM]|uniref:Asp23/Gls24 family envelope stress response protein n=1 Tax=Dehalobacter sp. DCM TaxID=2907827 RepID=UPI0030814AA5|nr:Asp23/Gls24 family envelope stress response protein [Dehalobacter sp. DCM]
MENSKIDNSIGSVRIADEVVEVIAGMAASEVEGVAELTSGFVVDIANMLGRGKNQAKSSKGIKVEIDEKEATVDLFLAAQYGSSIPDVAQKVQFAVKEAIEGMTGLTVNVINVHIQGIAFKNAADVKETKFFKDSKEKKDKDSKEKD